MNKKIIQKLSEDMAYAILANKEIRSVSEGVLEFSSCVGANLTVTSSDPMHISSPNGEFDIVVKERSMLEVLKEAFEKTYYSHLLDD
ncbi:MULTISPECIES: hypothetical protein [Pantoea]|uniref:hypothetical protein n=1 Tax=Pantoea TaxID=53335 RepID=UPI00123193A4|nr:MULTISPECIES: hypothetical protein [unclassified Pantoea]KAA6103345.1 hypothetical protein F3I21_01075 [Pantoea sp. B_9]KAA6111745.1 hypothetical protein F3I18_15095 [Pantoea sp. B_10]